MCFSKGEAILILFKSIQSKGCQIRLGQIKNQARLRESRFGLSWDFKFVQRNADVTIT